MANPEEVVRKWIKVPFEFNENGIVDSVSRIADVALQEIKSVAMTARLDRVMRPEFGTPFRLYPFELNLGYTDLTFYSNELTNSLTRQCIYSEIDHATVFSQDAGYLNVDISYIIKGFDAATNERFTVNSQNAR